jgi:hypothetical protein
MQSENLNAKVAILCPHIFFAYAFKGILEHYSDAEFVPDFVSTLGGTYSEVSKGKIRAWFAASGLPWRDVELTGLSAEEFFSKYKAVVAPHYEGWVKKSAVKKLKKVRVFYGTAKDIWGFALWNAYFDLI